MESRDTRLALNRKQGLFNFNRFLRKTDIPEKATEDAAEAPQSSEEKKETELQKIKNVVFNGKPKRIYKTNRNITEVPLKDPKRVYQCLREFNDLQAN